MVGSCCVFPESISTNALLSIKACELHRKARKRIRKTQGEACRDGPPLNMMDKPSRALPSQFLLGLLFANCPIYNWLESLYD